MKNRGTATVIADTYFTKLRWTNQVNVAFPTATNQQTVSLRGNSCFDPATGSASHQPTGFDQLSTMFGRYKVAASKLTVIYSNSSSTAINIMILPGVENTPISTIQQGYSNPYSKIRMLSPTGSGRSIVRFSHYMSTVKIRGEIEAKYDDDYAALISANPDRQWYWQILIEAADLVEAGQQTGNLTVIIDYYVKFSKRTLLAVS